MHVARVSSDDTRRPQETISLPLKMRVHQKRKNDDDDDDIPLVSSASSSGLNPLDKNGDEGQIPISVETSTFVRRSAKTTWRDIQEQMNNLGLVRGKGEAGASAEERDGGPDGGILMEHNIGETTKDLDYENEGPKHDDFLAFMRTDILPLQNEMDEYVAEKRQYANTLLSKLSDDLSEEKKQNDIHSEQVRERRRIQQEQENQRSKLVKELQRTEMAIALVQDEIERYRQKTSRELEACEEIELMRKQEEEKLRRRIALFANCTGIKWNYDSDPEQTIEALVVRRTSGGEKEPRWSSSK